MTWYEFIAYVMGDSRWRIKLETSECWLDGEKITQFEWGTLDKYGNVWDAINMFYAEYKNSTPTKNDKRSYFKAKSADDMTMGELARGDNREVCRAMLEGYILWAKVNGMIPSIDGWFYQSKTDPDLVILKSWVE